MAQIQQINLRTILDSRGNPTVEAEVVAEGATGRAAAPSGASTGMYEAKVRPPRDAVADAESTVIPVLLGEEVTDQPCIDAILREIDGTPDFSSIGANVAVAISLASAKAAASSLGLPQFGRIGYTI